MKYIILGIIFIWIFSKLAKFFLKTVFKQFIVNLEQQQKAHYEQQKPQKPEGSITIDNNPPKSSLKDKKGGEYVDYEIIE